MRAGKIAGWGIMLPPDFAYPLPHCSRKVFRDKYIQSVGKQLTKEESRSLKQPSVLLTAELRLEPGRGSGGTNAEFIAPADLLGVVDRCWKWTQAQLTGERDIFLHTDLPPVSAVKL